MKPAFFFDRDGVINVDHGYVSRAEDFEFMPGIFPVLRALAERGFRLVIVTNQSGIGRGYYGVADFHALTDWMLQRFSDEGVHIDAVYHCPHAPDEQCSCRKPEPEMFFQAEKELGINLSSSWMIGDKESDMQAALAAGIPCRVLLGTVTSSLCTHRVQSIDELMALPIVGE